MRRVFVCFLLVLYILISSGCSIINYTPPLEPEQGMEQKSNTPPEVVVPQKGGQLRIAIPQPDSLNPLLTQSKDMVSFFGLIFEGLVKIDGNMKPEPALADSWEFSEDKKIVYFHLRDGLRWQNGNEVTANDIIFTFQSLRGGKLDSFYDKEIANNVNIEEIGVKSNEPRTIYVQLKKPIPNILHIMSFPVLPESVYRSDQFMLDHKNDMEFLPTGTGPYKVDGNQKEDEKQLTLKRNENWWNKTPYIESIQAQIFRDSKQARTAFQSGQLDVLDTSVIYSSTFSESEDVDLYRYLTMSYEFLGFNFAHPVLRDEKVRQAIAYAINRKEIISKVYLNNAEAVDVPIPANSWLYDPESRIYDYDPMKASKVLFEAGWRDSDQDGVLDKIDQGGKVDLKFTILTNQDNEFRKDALEMIALQLHKVGIKVEPVTADWDTIYNEYLPQKHFDIILGGYYFGTYPDLAMLFHSNQTDMDMNNFIGYSNPEIDRLLDEIEVTFDYDVLKGKYSLLQKQLIQQLPYMSLYFRTASLITDHRVKGIRSPRELDVYGGIKDWYIFTQ